MNEKIEVAMMPGDDSGMTIRRNAWKRVAPSMRAACSSWIGMLS
jgi:hypothetical protein